jgi:molybdenum cofactor biosynthesis enzyme MoaA
MTLRSQLRAALAPALKSYPPVWNAVRTADEQLERARHSAARVLPVLIRPEPRKLHIAVTAYCDQRCVGCRYGRDFMPGSQLPWPVVRDLLDDARKVGMWEVRLYGGEPLLHRDITRMVEHTVGLGMECYITTNGIQLGDHIDELYAAGLRNVTIGFYGVGEAYDAYVQRRGRFARLEASIKYARERYPDLRIRINWLLMRPSCSVEALDAMLAFADRYDLLTRVDLIHYSLPYFQEGPDRCLQFRPEDEPAVREVCAALLERRLARPERFTQTVEAIRSMPDWLLLGPEMKVPCDAYQMIWVGADGTVQLCYVTFKLGNLHEKRFSEMMFTETHKKASRDAFQLNCPNCHCELDTRIPKHGPSRAKYR